MVCNVEGPIVVDKRKYYHAWHLVNGIPYSFTFILDEGHVVGGIPDIAPGSSKMEITKEEFYLPAPLADLEKENPYLKAEGDISTTPSEEQKQV